MANPTTKAPQIVQKGVSVCPASPEESPEELLEEPLEEEPLEEPPEELPEEPPPPPTAVSVGPDASPFENVGS